MGQSDAACFTLPVIEPGNPIILDGQCDPNIPVIQNFNITNVSINNIFSNSKYIKIVAITD